MTRLTPNLRRRRARSGGFTLLEAGMATVIIGVAFTAMLQLLAAGTVSNKNGTALTTAVHLAGNVHEASLRTPYDNLFTLQGTHSPPLDANLRSMAGMDGWQQVIDVTYVDPDLLTNAVPDTQEEPTARVIVTINRSGKFVYRASWIATKSQ